MIVGGLSANAYVLLYDPLLMLSVRDTVVIVNDIGDADASVYVPLADIVAPIVHVPIVTKVTRPELLLIVQTSVVRLVYVFVPVPADAVEVIVGGVVTNVYVAVYELPSIVSVLFTALVVKFKILPFCVPKLFVPIALK